MSYQNLIYDKEGAVTTVTLNRPEKPNAIDVFLLREIQQALKETGADDEVRVVIITGAGWGFCSGADLSAAAAFEEVLQARDRRERLEPCHMWITGPSTMDKPAIAAISSVAGGIRLGYGKGCILRVGFGHSRKSFRTVGEVNLGLYL